jgi:hypothetical protein
MHHAAVAAGHAAGHAARDPYYAPCSWICPMAAASTSTAADCKTPKNQESQEENQKTQVWQTEDYHLSRFLATSTVIGVSIPLK